MSSPTSDLNRISSLDVIRGIAICGLVPINIMDFAGTGEWLFSPGDLVGAEKGLWVFIQVFGAGKFMALFSLLFGAGIILQTRKAEANHISANSVFLPRLGWLWLIGMFHAYLVWSGDILVGYAISGLVLYFCRNWSPKIHVTLGVAMWAMVSLLLVIAAVLFSISGSDDFNMSNLQELIEEEGEKEVETFRGNWFEQLPTRASYAFIIHLLGIPFFLFWIAGSMMFLGMAMMKSGFFTGEWKPKSYWKMAVVGLAIGLTMSVTGNSLSLLIADDLGSLMWVLQISFWAIPILAVGYASLIYLWCESGWAKRIQQAFSSLGRMAFSNYLGQSLIMSLLFYGHGLSLKGQLDFSQILLVAFTIWIVQAAFSVFWLKRYRYGPMEWVWRCLTYRKRLPIRRKAIPTG